jgi:hypothetical protein
VSVNDAIGNDINIALSRRAGHSLPVRYEPAMRLLRLVKLLEGSRTGLSLDDMMRELEVGRRTADRAH